MSQISIPLGPYHDRTGFFCGIEMLDIYLQKQANQDTKRKLSACFVIIDEESSRVKGYYTLSNSGIPLDSIPGHITKNLPKSYKTIPATLIGRLAIDHRFQRLGLGKMLLIDAIKRCYNASSTIGSFAVVVDPIDRSAEEFYYNYGFIKLPDSGKMFMPMKTVDQLFIKNK